MHPNPIHYHGAGGLAILALIAKAAGEVLVNEHLVHLIADYVSILAGLGSLTWILIQAHRHANKKAGK